MTEKRFTKVEHIFELNDEGIKDNQTRIEYYYALDLIDLLNELSEENQKLKKYNKGQELEIIRLHNLADAMSAVLKELGIYDVYNDEQIENVKRRIINDWERNK